jgi:flagellar hook-basal body complex protein FliE
MAVVPGIGGEMSGIAQSFEGVVSHDLNLGPGAEARLLREMREQGLQTPSTEGRVGGAGEAGKTFMDVLSHSLEKVNQDQVQADHAIKEMVAGRNKNIHETMLAIERADSSMKLMMQVRNKVLDAYREIMRMQV